MASEISCALQSWLASHRLAELSEGLAQAGYTEIESLLEAEESALTAAATELDFQGAAYKRLVAELEALRRPPLPAPLRERVLELNPCQLMNLAAILEPAETDTAIPGAENGTQNFLKDQHGALLRPAQRLSARLDARLWHGLGGASEPRRWRFSLTSGQVQPILVPAFAQFESRIIVLMNFSKDEEIWVQRDQWEPLVTKALHDEQSVKLPLMILTGTASMACDSESRNLDSEALALAQEQGFSSYVGKIVFGLRGVVEMTAGEIRCKLAVGPPSIAKAVLCRGTALGGMLDGVAQAARAASRTFCRHWQPFQIISGELNSLLSISASTCSTSCSTADPDAGSPVVQLKEAGKAGDAWPPANNVEAGSSAASDMLASDVGGYVNDEVEVFQLFSISLSGKFAEKAAASSAAKEFEVGFNEMATGSEDDVGKQVRVIIQNLTASFAFIHLALVSPELAEAERRLVYRKSKGTAGAERAAQEQDQAKPTDLRDALGLGSAMPTPEPLSPVPPSSRANAKARSTLNNLPPVKTQFTRQTSPNASASSTPKRQLTSESPVSPKSAPVKGGRKNYAAAGHSDAITVAKARSLPPLCPEDYAKKEPEGRLGIAVIRRLAKEVFIKMDFDSGGILSSPKLTWGFDAVTPCFELACPGFGPSAFESSEADGSHANAYFAFLDKNRDGSISTEEFEYFFVNAAEMRPEQINEIEDALRLCISQLDKQRRSGAVLCTDGGNTKEVKVQVGHEMEVLYSVFPEKVSQLKTSFKCDLCLGTRAIIALIPAQRVINSLEQAFAAALCVVPLNPASSSGPVSLAVPPSSVASLDCGIRLYCGTQGKNSSCSFVQVGEDLNIKLLGKVSVVSMCTNINAALSATACEASNSQAAHIRRQETHALLEKIGSQQLKPDLTVTIKRELLPRLVQVLLSPTLLPEKALVPLSPAAPIVSNAGRNGILPAEEGPRILWPIVDRSHSYLFILEPISNAAQGKATGESVVCYSYNLDQVSEDEVDGCLHASITLISVPPGQYHCYIKARAAPGYSEWSHATYFRGVTKAEVKQLENNLAKASSAQDCDALRKALDCAEAVWLVDEDLIAEARVRLTAMEQENLVHAAMCSEDVNALTSTLTAAGGISGVSKELIKKGYMKLVELYAARLRALLDCEDTASEEALKAAIALLVAIPDHDCEEMIQEANFRIEALKVEPALTAAVAGDDLTTLMRQFRLAQPLAEACGTRWHGLLHDGRTRLGKLAEDNVKKATEVDTIEGIELAISQAEDAQKLMTVARKEKGNDSSWHSRTYVVDSEVIWEAKTHLQALRDAAQHSIERRVSKEAKVAAVNAEVEEAAVDEAALAEEASPQEASPESTNLEEPLSEEPNPESPTAVADE